MGFCSAVPRSYHSGEKMNYQDSALSLGLQAQMFHRDFWSYSYPQLVAVRFVEPSTTATPKMGWQYHHRTVGWFVISGYTNFGKRVGPPGNVYTRLEGKDISKLDRGRRWDDHPPYGIIKKFPYSSVPTKSPKLRSFSLTISIMRGMCSPRCAIKRRRKRGRKACDAASRGVADSTSDHDDAWLID